MFIQYKQFIDEYIALGHAKYVDINFSNYREISSNCYFMPHQAVFKASSTTSLRVVFDCSARTPSGRSLNDCFITAAPPQRDIFDLLVNFRCHKYALIADIRKMYRQIPVIDKHKPFQRILWRNNSSEKLKCIELQTVTYK